MSNGHEIVKEDLFNRNQLHAIKVCPSLNSGIVKVIMFIGNIIFF